MSDQVMLVSQSPDHLARVGETLMIDGDPFVIREIKPKREAGVFIGWGQAIEYNVVEVTVARFDGYDS